MSAQFTPILEGGIVMRHATLCLCLILGTLVGCDSENAGPIDTTSSESVVEEPLESEHSDEEVAVHLTAAQREAAGIVVEALTPRALEAVLQAPGEIRLNAYSTYQVAPRIQAQVNERHARLGDAVERGQPLVTLSSVDMAEAQGSLVVASREWTRVQGLGREVVSAGRFIEAEVAAQQAHAQALAYGMSVEQVEALVQGGDAGLADGQFTLLAPETGTVVRDDFVVGEAIESGRMLVEITDESTLWVEARPPAHEATTITVGSPARVQVGERWIDGEVIQAHHALDEGTRTLPVRVEIPNPDDDLHPGLFVDVLILDEDTEPVLAVPETAVLRSADGDWQVFIAVEEDEFQPIEVEIEEVISGFAIVGGLAPGTRVVTEGSFFLQSQMAKSGFDIHAH